MPVGKEGSKLRAFEKASWPELDRLCREVPEAGVHYQDCMLYGRKKDEGTAVGTWFQELMKEDPWFKDLMPEVGPCCFSFYHNDIILHDFGQLEENQGFLLLVQAGLSQCRRERCGFCTTKVNVNAIVSASTWR